VCAVAEGIAYTLSKGQQNVHANKAVGKLTLLRPLILQKFKLQNPLFRFILQDKLICWPFY